MCSSSELGSVVIPRGVYRIAAEAVLTPAERRVFPLLLDPALTRKEIAAQLHVAPRTVRHHSDRICEKLGITAHHRRAELITRYGAPADRMADLEQRVAALEARCGA